MDHVHRLMGRGGGGGGRKGIDFMSEWSEREADMQGKNPNPCLRLKSQRKVEDEAPSAEC